MVSHFLKDSWNLNLGLTPKFTSSPVPPCHVGGREIILERNIGTMLWRAWCLNHYLDQWGATEGFEQRNNIIS